MPREEKTPPPGAYVELDLDLIDEGAFKALVKQKITQAHRGLLDYEKESGDLTASAAVTIKIKLERQKGSQQFMEVSYSGKTDVPVVTRGTLVRAAGEKLLCQPNGSSEGDPDQQLFYDAHGRIIGGGAGAGAGKESGVAGRIGQAAAGGQ